MELVTIRSGPKIDKVLWNDRKNLAELEIWSDWKFENLKQLEIWNNWKFKIIKEIPLEQPQEYLPVTSVSNSWLPSKLPVIQDRNSTSIKSNLDLVPTKFYPSLCWQTEVPTVPIRKTGRFLYHSAYSRTSRNEQLYIALLCFPQSCHYYFSIHYEHQIEHKILGKAQGSYIFFNGYLRRLQSSERLHRQIDSLSQHARKLQSCCQRWKLAHGSTSTSGKK